MSDTINSAESLQAAEARAAALPPEVWGEQLDAVAGGETSWLWDGYLAHGNITLLTSQWKSGKTTLLAMLLARREDGGSLAGLKVTQGRTVVVTEEPALLWTQRRRKLGFGASVAFQCRPFRGKPTPQQWLALVGRLADLRAQRGVDLAVIDNLASFLPGRNEADANLMLETLAPLQDLTARGMALLLVHHPRKGQTIDGQASRGSGALTGYVDIVIEMSGFAHAPPEDRRRLLRTFSRHEQTPLRLAIEMNAEGTDYTRAALQGDAEFAAGWERLRLCLSEAHRKLTRREILAAWPAEEVPSQATAWRWLDEAVARGLVLRDGEGHKSAPFRYWLPGQQEKWQADPVHALQELTYQDQLSRAELERQYGSVPWQE
jgi:hypothetical protein